MRRSLGVNIRRVYEHTTFMTNRRLLAYTIAVLVTNIVTTVITIFTGWQQTSLYNILSMQLGFSYIIYKFLILFQSIRIGREVNQGEVQLYLSHTLTRSEYLFSVLLVVCITPLILFITTYTAVVSIITPTVILSREVVKGIAYISLDLLIFATIILHLAISGRENTSTILGLFLTLGGPMAIPIAIYLYVYIYNTTIKILCYVTLIFLATLQPFMYSIYRETFTIPPFIPSPPLPLPEPTQIAIASTIVASVFLVMMFKKFKKRDL